MINRIRYNESLKKAHREHHSRIKNAQTIVEKRKGAQPIDRKEISEEELQQIVLKIKENAKSERIKELIKSIILMFLIIIIAYFFIKWLFQL